MRYKTKHGITENIEEADISICNYDKERCCHCMTKSIESEDKTHFYCGKCGATK